MASASRSRDRAAYTIFWLLTGFAAAMFLLEYAAELWARKANEVAAARKPWLALHALAAIPVLLIAPFQFASSLRARFPQAHRWAGRAFLSVAIAAAITAIALAMTNDNPAARVPLALFGLVWLFVSVAAWLCARAKDFANHRQFVVRSFAIASAFVWIRVLGMFADSLLGFIADPQMRGATREWLSFTIPLLAAELWLGWWAALRNAWRRAWLASHRPVT